MLTPSELADLLNKHGYVPRLPYSIRAGAFGIDVDLVRSDNHQVMYNSTLKKWLSLPSEDQENDEKA